MPSRRLVVLGGGMTGLSAAYEALKLARKDRVPLEATVLEAAPRPGGKVRTERHDSVECEAGPDSFITSKPQVLELIRELGLAEDLLATHPTKKTVHVLVGGRLVPLPDGLMLILPTRILPFAVSELLSWKAKLRMALEPFIAAAPEGLDESLGAFFRRRLGDEAVEKLVAPMLAGIYASDAFQMSLQSTFPQFGEMERKGGLLRAMWSRRKPSAPPAPGISMFMTLKGGLARLTDTLAARLPPGCLRLDQTVLSVRRRGGKWEVRTAAEVFEADAVISALPANALAPLLADLDPELSGVLGEIPFVSTATVCLAYAAATFPGDVDGFGFLIPRGEKRRIAAATYVSTKFPGRVSEDIVLIRCFLGGAGREDQVQGRDADLSRAAREELRDILALGEAQPLWSSVARWPAGNPQYNVGHALRLKRIASCLQAHPGLVLAGASYRGVGLPDCIQSGRQAAAQALAGKRSAAGVC